jgi:hypothetical protein
VLKCFIFTALALLISSCSSSENTSLNNSTLHYNLTMGEGGGVTGISEGVIIDTAGVVYSFRGRTVEGSIPEEKSVLTEEEIAQINELISEIENIDYGETGNLYKFIILKKSNNPVLRFSWSDSPSKDDRIQLLNNFYNNLNKILNQSKP